MVVMDPVRAQASGFRLGLILHTLGEENNSIPHAALSLAVFSSVTLPTAWHTPGFTNTLLLRHANTVHRMHAACFLVALSDAMAHD